MILIMDGKYNDDLYSTIRKWRTVLNEGVDEKEKENDEESKNKDGVPYTMQDELMQSITQTCKQQFGADFSQSKTPMLYYPDDGNVVLSGVVGSMNDTKFHFKYKDEAGGCYVWTSPVILTQDTLRTLSVIYGVYTNWKKELGQTEDIKPMSLKNEADGEDYVPSIPNGMV